MIICNGEIFQAKTNLKNLTEKAQRGSEINKEIDCKIVIIHSVLLLGVDFHYMPSILDGGASWVDDCLHHRSPTHFGPKKNFVFKDRTSSPNSVSTVDIFKT